MFTFLVNNLFFFQYELVRVKDQLDDKLSSKYSVKVQSATC